MFLDVGWIPELYYALPADLAFISAGILLACAIFDYFFFVFNPLQKNFIIDQEGESM